MPIKFEHVTHIYGKGTPSEYVGLNGIDVSFTEGKMTAIIGKTGSGKSTLVQHLNALLLPSEGTVYVLDREIHSDAKPKGLKSLRGDVGLVFQFPEYQLFEETVLKDVSFGPKNFGVSEEDAIAKAKHALKLVGFDESLFERSPLELSGGQKRRVAIAGILAMNPKVLVLDEPTAMLDPNGRKEVLKALGKKVPYKSKGEDCFTVVIQTEPDRKFYGWLASMGRSVHILKPKKVAASYREYLKSIAKDYKIDK